MSSVESWGTGRPDYSQEIKQVIDAVKIRDGAQISGTVQISGTLLISGGIIAISGEVEIKSGAYVITDINVAVSSGLIVAMSGQTITVASGASVLTQPGIQISGSVIVSGNISTDASGSCQK